MARSPKTKKDHSFRKRHIYLNQACHFFWALDLVILAPPQSSGYFQNEHEKWRLICESPHASLYFCLHFFKVLPLDKRITFQGLPSGKGRRPPVAEAEAAAAAAAPKAEASAWQALNRRNITAKNNRLFKLVNMAPSLLARLGQFVVVLVMKGSSSTTISLLAVFLGEIAAWRIGFKLLPGSAGGRNDLWWTACRLQQPGQHLAACCCCLGADPDGDTSLLLAVDIVVDGPNALWRPTSCQHQSRRVIAFFLCVSSTHRLNFT